MVYHFFVLSFTCLRLIIASYVAGTYQKEMHELWYTSHYEYSCILLAPTESVFLMRFFDDTQNSEKSELAQIWPTILVALLLNKGGRGNNDTTKMLCHICTKSNIIIFHGNEKDCAHFSRLCLELLKRQNV